MDPLVSILIPAYNAGQWISQTIQSALAQTWKRKEIVIVDDGSRDNTLAIARQFESPEVLVVSQSNQGAAAARNKAFSVCQGDYLQWLDADDLLAPDKISLQLTPEVSTSDSDILLSSSWGYFRHNIDKARFIPTAHWCDLCPVEWLLRKMECNIHMPNMTWLVSRKISELAGPWDTRLTFDDDGEYFLRVILASKAIMFVAASRSYYRRTGSESMSKIGNSTQKLDSLLISLQLHVQSVLSSANNPRARAACLRYLENWTGYFYPYRMDFYSTVQAMAVDLGGSLNPPSLPWKYAWIARLFGRRSAMYAQYALPNLKHGFLSQLERLCTSNKST
jgi:glycosyltransferase involved in cell wall biosynthesis